MNNLKERRLKAGLTQAELASLVRYSPGHISNIERGRYKPSAEMLERIDVAFGGRRKPEKRTAEMEELHRIWIRDYAPENKG